MPQPREWPFEKPAKGALRPWFASATGYLAVLFGDGDEAERAQRGLVERGVPEGDVRLYTSEQILDTLSRLQDERSNLAKAVAALMADPAGKRRFLDNANAGGAALWLYAPTDDRADRLLRLLADYNYVSARYFGQDGEQEVLRDAD
jgi:hypothetical protein